MARPITTMMSFTHIRPLLPGTYRTVGFIHRQYTVSHSCLQQPTLMKSSSLLSSSSSSCNISKVLIRRFQSKKFNRNLEFFTPSTTALTKDRKNLQVLTELNGKERPLILLFTWLMAKDKHAFKFVKFYNNLGVDVLKVRISPFDLIRPLSGAQPVAENVVEFLHANPRLSPVIVHGFSVGAYLFCEVMVKTAKNMELNGPLLDRFIGQIWDSPVDVTRVPVGVSRALTDNKLLQSSLTKYLEWYLKANYETSTKHFIESSDKMHNCFVNVPALFLLSKNDPVSTPEENEEVYARWERKGIPVFVKCWEKSAHVCHYVKHREEYEYELMAFLEKIQLREAIQSKATTIAA